MMRDNMKINVRAVHHITLRVADLERSRAFYEDILGFAVEKPSNDPISFLRWQHANCIETAA